MNLREHIKKVLNEQTQIPIRLLRRLHYLDDNVIFTIKYDFKPEKICKYYRSSDELFYTIVEHTLVDFHSSYFDDIDYNSDEWRKMYKVMLKYIENKFRDKIKEYYHTNCGS